MAATYYSQELHGPYETFDLGDFDLEEGGKIRGLKLAYTTFGKLTPKKDNAILFPTWYSGTTKILEQAYIGAGRALDPSRYFIILVNQIGNGLSSSPSNAPVPFNAAAFPRITISDDVRARYKLVAESWPPPLSSAWRLSRRFNSWANVLPAAPGASKIKLRATGAWRGAIEKMGQGRVVRHSRLRTHSGRQVEKKAVILGLCRRRTGTFRVMSRDWKPFTYFSSEIGVLSSDVV